MLIGVIREARLEDDATIAHHFYQMWRDLDTPDYAIRTDWLECTLRYIGWARQTLSYAAFVAEHEDVVIGSVSCQILTGAYPMVLSPDYRKDGYIWGVYVEPDYRRCGIATRLTDQAIAHLRQIGCTRAVLNASVMGRPVYERMGFVTSNVMQLEL